MSPEEACRLLGVGIDTDYATLRAAYRARIRAVHPDHHGGDHDATAATAALNEAFRLLRTRSRSGAPRPASSSTAPPPTAPPPTTSASASAPGADGGAPADGSVAILRPDGDSLAVTAPAADVFTWLLTALNTVGEVTFIDSESGLLEAVVEESSGNRTSVLVSMQGRADATEAFCSAERLSGVAAVDLPAIVDRLVAVLARG